MVADAKRVEPGSAARDRPHDQVRLSAFGDLGRERRVRRLVGQVFLARIEPQHRPALLRHLVANGSAQRRVCGFERAQKRALSHGALDLHLNLAADTGEGAQVRRQDDPYQRSVCTSTESTDGKSCTIAFQLSPASADAYTWPPVVPKYTPHESSESTVMASRRTFT